MPKRKPEDDVTDVPATSIKKKNDIIKTINALPFDDFHTRFYSQDRTNKIQDVKTNLGSLSLTLKPSSALTKPELDQCLSLIEETSKQDYDGSSIGWHPSRKRREMKEEEMRYYLLKDTATSTIQGFLSFMFTHDSIPSVPVVYIYEIHLASILRGHGLGKHLMQTAEDIAALARVDKVMLTCFVANTAALDFYHRRGYKVDVSSPEDRTIRRKTVKSDYSILSNDVVQTSI